MPGHLLKPQRLLLVLIVLACASSAYKLAHLPAAGSLLATPVPAREGPAYLHSDFVSRQQQISTHAASLIELKDGKLRAFWFAGSREGAEDVEIRSSVYDGKHWSDESRVTDRILTQNGLWRYVKKVGNPVAARAPNGELWLTYVTVSLGGWAGSSLTLIRSQDEGRTWSAPQRIVTTPWFNISTLIKGTPFYYNDGTLGLPVYHEFLGKFGELLHLSAEGKVLDKQRLSAGKTAIQPVMLVQDYKQALVLMRYTGAPPMRMIATRSHDGGKTWDVANKTTLPNPDAAISAVVLDDGRMLLVANDVEQGRAALSLLLSVDHGASWRNIYRFEDQRDRSNQLNDYLHNNASLALTSDALVNDGSAYAKSAQRNKCEGEHCIYEFSYPYLIQTQSGDLHLVYTWNRSFIKHITFSVAWLDERMKGHDASLH